MFGRTMKQQDKAVQIWLLLGIISSLTGLCGAISLRKIYTLFTTKKTWNEAKAICENQLGQMIKIQGDSQIEEINYLDNEEWDNRIYNELSTSGVWSGLHMPFSNTTWTNQDCEPISEHVTVSLAGGIASKCAVIKTSYSMINGDCNNKNMFVCQRTWGDCWYEPFFEEEPLEFVPSVDDRSTVYNVTDPSDCAVRCRNYYDTNSASECWGFTYYPSYSMCMLHKDNSSYASVKYLLTAHRKAGPTGSTFYIRRCFEGSLDTKTYDSFVNTNTEPETTCSTTPYRAEEPAADVCFCSTKEHPPIPTPTSSEDKAKQYEKELSIDSSNTSSALRKLTSAEDNRPSAVGVGFVGVGLLTAVFGGLFLLDLNVLMSGLKSLLCSTETTVVTRETDC